MSVALLLVTHESIGNDMLKVTGSILNENIFNTACIEIPMSSDPANMKQRIANALNSLSTSEGVLILTDSYGSTPCNIATEFLDQKERILISGLNLPMLIRVMNYRLLPLNELKNIAVDGGKRGITTIPA
jgi:PTS system ascorbate-specific IIA component